MPKDSGAHEEGCQQNTGRIEIRHLHQERGRHDEVRDDIAIVVEVLTDGADRLSALVARSCYRSVENVGKSRQSTHG